MALSEHGGLVHRRNRRAPQPRDKESVEDGGKTPGGQRWHVLHGGHATDLRHFHVPIEYRQQTGAQGMQPLRLTEQFKTLFSLAVHMTETAGVDAILLLVEGTADWPRLRDMAPDTKLLVAADTLDQLTGAKEAGLEPIRLDMPDNPVYEKLTQAVLEAVADDILAPGRPWWPSIAASTPTRSTA